jgi:hypothetical protein
MMVAQNDGLGLGLADRLPSSDHLLRDEHTGIMWLAARVTRRRVGQ